MNGNVQIVNNEVKDIGVGIGLIGNDVVVTLTLTSVSGEQMTMPMDLGQTMFLCESLKACSHQVMEIMKDLE